MTRTVFRGYDQAALDREYDNRSKVREAPAHLEWYARASAETRQSLPARLDLAYGEHAGQTLDVFPATGPGEAPLQVFIHGGYWHLLDKADFSFVARGFQPAGATVAVINYALVPTVNLDELVRQCRAAVAWLYRNAPSLGADPQRIFVSGHSAGGHLAAMLLATDWPAFAGLPPDVVKGAAGLSGLYDLEPIRLSYLNRVLDLDPEAARRNSPVHLAPARAGPLLLAVGGLEGPEYHRQTAELAQAWHRHGLPCEVMDMPGHDHFTIARELGRPGSALADAMRRQMGLASAGQRDRRSARPSRRTFGDDRRT
jgi:arylformamidase